MKLIILFMLPFIAGTTKNSTPESNGFKQPENDKTVLTKYEVVKSNITNYRKQLSNKKADYALLEKAFVSVVADSLFPHWYGTAWDFNGTTQIPLKGSIACGYFVATILRDAGVDLNRIKIGQAASEITVRTFAEKKYIKTYSNKPLDSTLAFVRKEGFGIYLVGLDNHVGFLYNDGAIIWFIHSKGISEKAVVKEVANTSGILYYSKYRIVGKISNNKTLLKNWIMH